MARSWTVVSSRDRSFSFLISYLMHRKSFFRLLRPYKLPFGPSKLLLSSSRLPFSSSTCGTRDSQLLFAHKYICLLFVDLRHEPV
jgi:hypothetical protein